MTLPLKPKAKWWEDFLNNTKKIKKFNFSYDNSIIKYVTNKERLNKILSAKEDEIYDFM